MAPLSNLLMEFPADIMLLLRLPYLNLLLHSCDQFFGYAPFGLGAGIAANYLMECAAWLASLPMASIPVTQEVLLISLIVFAAASVVIVMIRWEGFRLRLTACTTAFLLVFTALGAGFEQEALEIGGFEYWKWKLRSSDTGSAGRSALLRRRKRRIFPDRAYLRSRGIGRLIIF